VNVSQSGGIVQLNQDLPPTYPYSYTFTVGESVKLEAVPGFGYRFDHWGGDITGSDNPRALVASCDTYVIARFSRNWPLIGGIIGGAVVLVGLIVSVFILRRRAR